MCGKQCYKSKGEAAASRNAMLHHSGKAMGKTNVYFCGRCAAYHWGHDAKRNIQKRRE